MDSCRTCRHAYLRTERTRKANWECCEYGGFVRRMPDDYACTLYECDRTQKEDWPCPGVLRGPDIELA